MKPPLRYANDKEEGAPAVDSPHPIKLRAAFEWLGLTRARDRPLTWPDRVAVVTRNPEARVARRSISRLRECACLTGIFAGVRRWRARNGGLYGYVWLLDPA